MSEPSQSSQHIMLVRPAGFRGNPQTRASNVFQDGSVVPDPRLAQGAQAEFDALVDALQGAGLAPVVFPDLAGGRVSPDAVFPNNWLSTHADGSVVIYPLLAPIRRLERRLDLVRELEDEHGFLVTRLIDLSRLEGQQQYLEGTGSLVLDRPAGTAYAVHSPRTHAAALAAFSTATGYRVQAFNARIRDKAVYHTNVIMSIGSGYALLCRDAVSSPAELRRLEESLESAGHHVIDISLDQACRFAGNCLELAPATGKRLLISATAVAALTTAQLAMLERHADLLPVAVPLIERHGGGSVRCMIAEIHLPRPTPRNQEP